MYDTISTPCDCSCIGDCEIGIYFFDAIDGFAHYFHIPFQSFSTQEILYKQVESIGKIFIKHLHLFDGLEHVKKIFVYTFIHRLEVLWKKRS